jgi:hypothetical protein
VTIRRVTFRQSGGFAGLIRGSELAGDALSAADRRALERQLQSRSAAPVASALRDGLTYELEVETDTGTMHLEFGEDRVPADLAPLVEGMASRARPVSL